MLSHQNFPDMLMGQDPNFKFTLARSIYKTVLRFVNAQHGQACMVQPLAPGHFCVSLDARQHITLAWTATPDPLEPTAVPTAYKVYVAAGSAGFDNGTLVSGTRYSFRPEPGGKYKLRVTAVNRGGESFPTETLTAVYNPSATRTLCIVNGFHRLAAPAVVNDGTRQGFDLDADIGVQRGMYAGWNGRQTCFDKAFMGKEGPGGLGYCGNELAGTFISGNTFNYVSEHADAIGTTRYNIVSCSAKALEAGLASLDKADCVDLILGLERYDGHSLVSYRAFSAALRQKLEQYLKGGGRLVASGAYIGSDMPADSDKAWLASLLKLRHEPSDSTARGPLNGLGLQTDIYRTPCSRHYAAQHPDIVAPVAPAYCAMQYADGTSAAVAYGGTDYRCFSAGFPLECIQDRKTFAKVMAGILQFLLEQPQGPTGFP